MEEPKVEEVVSIPETESFPEISEVLDKESSNKGGKKNKLKGDTKSSPSSPKKTKKSDDKNNFVSEDAKTEPENICKQDGDGGELRRRWDLASLMFPDGNLPQSWLNIMRRNQLMSPFDDLHDHTEGKSKQKKIAVKEDITEEVKSEKSESNPVYPSAEDNEKSDGTNTIDDQEVGPMPELSAMIEKNNNTAVNDYEGKIDGSKEEAISDALPLIQPYDLDVADDPPQLVKEVKKEREEEPKIELAVKIQVMETTGKIGAAFHDIAAAESPSTKTMKRKGSSVVHNHHNGMNNKLKSHISQMQRESKKASPDVELLRRQMCLEETFQYRMSKFMKDNENSIEDLLKEFPALKIASIIMDEFERVVEVTNPAVRCTPITFLESALQKRYDRVIAKARLVPSTDRAPLITSALTKLDQNKGNAQIKKIVGSICMIFKFSVDHGTSSVIQFQKEKDSSSYPSIGLPKMVMKEKNILEEQTTIRVFLEGQEIFKVTNVYEGLLAIFAISHVFNLDYDAKIEPLMRYFEFLVDIPQIIYQEDDPLPSDDESGA